MSGASTQDIFSEGPIDTSLRGNVVWSVLANIIYGAGRICVIVLLTHFFSTQQVGQVLFALAILTPICYFLNLETRSVYVTDAQRTFGAGDFFTLRLFSSAVFLTLVIAALSVLYSKSPWQSLAIIFFLAGLRISEGIGDVYLGVLQKGERLKEWAISQMLKTACILTSMFLLSITTSNVVWALAGWTGATLFITLTYDRSRAGRVIPIRLDLKGTTLRDLIRRAFPLGMFVTVAILNQQVGQYYLKVKFDFSAVAYYGVLLMYVSGMTTLQNGINQAILSRLASRFADSLGRYWLLLGRVIGVSFLTTLVATVLVAWQGRRFLGWLHGPEYAEFSREFGIVILFGGLLLIAMTLGDAVVAAQRFKSRLMAAVAGIVTHILGCAVMVPKLGLMGAAWSAVASAVMSAVICAVVLVVISIYRNKIPAG